MKKDLLLILTGIMLSTGGAYLNHSSNRAPASLNSTGRDLGLRSINPQYNRSGGRPQSNLSVPTIETRRATTTAEVKALEESLTAKMANDSRYTKSFEMEDLTRVSVCAITKADTQIGLTQFKQEISVDESQANRIFRHCLISVHSARIAFVRTQQRNTSAPQIANRGSAPRNATGKSENATGNTAANPAEANALTSTEVATTEVVDPTCDNELCKAYQEGGKDFVGPPRPSTNNGETFQQAFSDTNVNSGTPFGNGLGI